MNNEKDNIGVNQGLPPMGTGVDSNDQGVTNSNYSNFNNQQQNPVDTNNVSVFDLMDQFSKNNQMNGTELYQQSSQLDSQMPVQQIPTQVVEQSPVQTIPTQVVEQTPVQTVPTQVVEQSPVQTVPTQAVEQAPVQTVPTQAVEQAPIQTVPTQAIEQAPVQTVPTQVVEQAPVQTVPTQAVEQAPVQTVPTQVVEQAPVQTVPTQAVEQAPIQTVPTQAVEQTPLEQQVLDQSVLNQVGQQSSDLIQDQLGNGEINLTQDNDLMFSFPNQSDEASLSSQTASENLNNDSVVGEVAPVDNSKKAKKEKKKKEKNKSEQTGNNKKLLFILGGAGLLLLIVIGIIVTLYIVKINKKSELICSREEIKDEFMSYETDALEFKGDKFISSSFRQEVVFYSDYLDMKQSMLEDSKNQFSGTGISVQTEETENGFNIITFLDKTQFSSFQGIEESNYSKKNIKKIMTDKGYTCD